MTTELPTDAIRRVIDAYAIAIPLMGIENIDASIDTHIDSGLQLQALVDALKEAQAESARWMGQCFAVRETILAKDARIAELEAENRTMKKRALEHWEAQFTT